MSHKPNGLQERLFLCLKFRTAEEPFDIFIDDLVMPKIGATSLIGDPIPAEIESKNQQCPRP
jgi:hypothetical protein